MTNSYELETPDDINDDVSCDPLYDTDTLWKDTQSEFIGTFVFVYISLSGVNQALIMQGGNLAIALCFAFGLTTGIFIAGKSGGHLNPAVSFTAMITNVDFKFNRFLMYACAQVLGGFGGALLVMAMYYSYINNFTHKELFAGTFGTVKSPHVSLFSAIIDQFIGSIILIGAIVYVPDGKYKPIAIGCTLGALGLFQGVNGFALNLARDFGPRIVASMAIGRIAFSASDYCFWIPMVIPFLGMPVGYYIIKYIKSLE